MKSSLKKKKIIVRLTVSKLERECEIVFEFRSASHGSVHECRNQHTHTQKHSGKEKTPFRQYFYGKEIICITESNGRLLFRACFVLSAFCTTCDNIALRTRERVVTGRRERESGESWIILLLALIYLSKSFSNISKDFLVFDDVSWM